MTGKFATTTDVPAATTRAEIETTLAKYGADAFGIATEPGRAQIQFRMSDRWYRFTLLLPDPKADEFWIYSQGSSKFRRTETAGMKRYDQAVRTRWRALLLVIRAKLEAVAIGITSFEDEFLAATVTPGGATVGDVLRPQITEAYRLGPKASPLMIGGPA